MIITEPQLHKTDAEIQFANWLTTQRNSNGNYFQLPVANGYARNLRTEPPKLDIALTLEERDVFRCRTIMEFDALNRVFIDAYNFREVNQGANHGAFSAGLAAYRRYLEFIENNGEMVMSESQPNVQRNEETENLSHSSAEPQIVDFSHPELCCDCDPLSCIVEGNDYSGGNWRDLLFSLTEAFLQSKPRAAELCYTNLSSSNRGEVFMTGEKPKFSARQLSNGYWINVHLGIRDLVSTIGRLCEFCGVDLRDVRITYVPKKFARGVRSKDKLSDHSERFVQQNLRDYFDMSNVGSDVISASNVPDVVIDVLKKNYAQGFRFDTTYVNLLSSASGVEVDERMRSTLKRMMFKRGDGVYFLLDVVADAAIRKDMIDFSDEYLREYGCFEIPELYKLYEDKINSNCIRNADDFEDFYKQIGKSGISCVQAPNVGNRIARYSNGNVWSTFQDVAAKIVAVVSDEFYGSCNEDDLHVKFCAFSTELLGKIIKQCAADELIRVEINDSICYQTYDALGLPDDFSNVLAAVLERFDDIGLEPSQSALHTAISLELGVNFMVEFNLPDWETYRRLIALFYKAEPRREWKANIFGEVTG